MLANRNIVSSKLPTAQEEILKFAYMGTGQVSVGQSSETEKSDAQALAQNGYMVAVSSDDFVLLLKGWNYVEQHFLVNAETLASTHKIIEGTLNLHARRYQRTQDEVSDWENELLQSGIERKRISIIQNALAVAGYLNP